MFFVSINQRVVKNKENNDEIELLVGQYKNFILSCAKKASNKSNVTEHDDEYSIALMAFVEAIKSYDISKGNFLIFSKFVIKNRIIDYYRKESRHWNSQPIDNEDDSIDITEAESIKRHKEDDITEYRRLEIQQLSKELSEWGISFSELVEISPKHVSTKKIAVDVVEFLMSDEKYILNIKSTKQLPLAEIEKKLSIPRKKLERLRKYVVSVIIIISGDYQYISSYLGQFTKKRG